MRKIIALSILLSVYVYAAGQVLIVSNPADYKHIKDSITESYYPGMYSSNQSSWPLVPSKHFEIRSDLKTLTTPYDSIKAVVRIFFYGSYGSSNVEVTRQSGKNVGLAMLELKDYTYPTIDKDRTHYTEIKIKRLKTHCKLKFVTYIRCDTPEYPKREIKRITTYASYYPSMCGMVGAEMWVDHLPYSTNPKYGGPCTDEDVKKYIVKSEKKRAKSKFVQDNWQILQRNKKLPRESKIDRKLRNLSLESEFTPAQIKEMEKDSKAMKKQRRKERFKKYLQDVRSGWYDK